MEVFDLQSSMVNRSTRISIGRAGGGLLPDPSEEAVRLLYMLSEDDVLETVSIRMKDALYGRSH